MAESSSFNAPVSAMSEGDGRARNTLRGKKALVTGASRGIGRGIAVALGERGATVYAVARGKEGLAETAARVRAAGGECVEVPVDLSSDDAMEALWRDIDGPLDLVVNCAYSAVDTLQANGGKSTPSWRKSIDGTNQDEQPGKFWDVVNGVGLRSVYVGSVYALRHFAACNDGRPRTLINVSSWGGCFSIFDTAYMAGKSGVDRLTAELAREAPPGVVVSTYYPGIVATEKLSKEINDPNDKLLTPWNAESPLFVGRALAAALPDEKLMLSMHAKIVVTAELAKKVGAVDEKGFRPVSLRSLRYLVSAAVPKLAGTVWMRIIPDVCVPLWIMQVTAGSIKLW